MAPRAAGLEANAVGRRAVPLDSWLFGKLVNAYFSTYARHAQGKCKVAQGRNNAVTKNGTRHEMQRVFSHKDVVR